MRVAVGDARKCHTLGPASDSSLLHHNFLSHTAHMAKAKITGQQTI